VRILLFDPVIDGHHLEYAAHLTRYLREAGDEVIFATRDVPPRARARLAEYGIEDVRYIAKGWGSRLPGHLAQHLSTAGVVARSLRLASREGVDTVHFLYLDRSELAMLISATLHRPQAAVFGTIFWPYFVHAADERVSAEKRLFHAASRFALRRLLDKGVMLSLFVHSERIRSLLLAQFSNPPSKGSIVVVPDPAKEAPQIPKAQARAELDLPPRTRILLFFGAARFDKGPDTLLDVLHMLQGDWAVVMAGEKGILHDKAIEGCRAVLPSPDRLITRFGYVSESDADRYFRAADGVVLPYRKLFKGTSGVLQRAAASGVPVIATDVGDIGSTVRDEGLGIVVPAESPEDLRAALQGFLARSHEMAEQVRPRALRYALANDWTVLGAVTREQYLAVQLN
jgi:glycosyltransferase involved in cell wall biosynthesis